MIKLNKISLKIQHDQTDASRGSNPVMECDRNKLILLKWHKIMN